MKKQRHFSRILSFVLAVGMLSGCSAGTATPSKDASESKADTQSTAEPQPAAEKPTLPLTTSGETLTVATMDNWFSTKSYADNLPVYQELERLTGVKINWEVTPINDYDQVMTTRLAAGVSLPDIFMVPWESNADKLGLDGVSMPMNELIEKNAFYLNQLMAKYPVVRAGITSADGNIYSYPGFGEGFVTNAAEILRTLVRISVPMSP